jgi:hypothetical protein
MWRHLFDFTAGDVRYLIGALGFLIGLYAGLLVRRSA